MSIQAVTWTLIALVWYSGLFTFALLLAARADVRIGIGGIIAGYFGVPALMFIVFELARWTR